MVLAGYDAYSVHTRLLNQSQDEMRASMTTALTALLTAFYTGRAFFKTFFGPEKLARLRAIRERVDPARMLLANHPIDEKTGKLKGPEVVCRTQSGQYITVTPKDVDLMDVSPQQIWSVATAMIPFLEHDDANRALMGSNMQRQAVPLLNPRTPFVGTGLEEKVAIDSGAVVIARRAGVVTRVTADEIIVDSAPAERSRKDEDQPLAYKSIVAPNLGVAAGNFVVGKLDAVGRDPVGLAAGFDKDGVAIRVPTPIAQA